MSRLDPSGFKSIPALIQTRRSELNDLIAIGKLRPVVYPYDFFAIYFLFFALWLPLPKYEPLRTIWRWTVAIVITVLSLDGCFYSRTTTLANGYIVGLTTAWGIVWTWSAFVCNDFQRDFRRIQRDDGGWPTEPYDSSAVTISNAQASSVDNDVSRQNGQLNKRKADKPDIVKGSRPGGVTVVRGKWQSFPLSAVDRFYWAYDLLTNFRGVGWNWKCFREPPLPVDKAWETGKAVNGDVLLTKAAEQEYRSRRVRRSTLQFLLCYILVDFCKVTMLQDRYFWGEIDATPPTWLPEFVRSSQYWMQAFHLLITIFGTVLALRFVFNAMSFTFLSVFPSLGFTGHLSEVWLNTPYNGPLSSIADRGLSGFWGTWWHQLFRFGFTSIGKLICKHLGIPTKGRIGSLVLTFVAFFISGTFHAAGSFTMNGPTNPLNPFLFFILQFVGITIQNLFKLSTTKLGIHDSIQLPLRRFTNVAFTTAWLFFTAPLFADDVARSGLWLFEPLPISPLRGLGFGIEGNEGWFPVERPFLEWYTADKWWQSGIRVL